MNGKLFKIWPFNWRKISFCLQFYFDTKKRQNNCQLEAVKTKHTDRKSINDDSCAAGKTVFLFEHSIHCYRDITRNIIVTQQQQQRRQRRRQLKKKMNYRIKLFIFFLSLVMKESTCDSQNNFVQKKHDWRVHSFCIKYAMKRSRVYWKGTIHSEKNKFGAENEVIFIAITFQRRHIHPQRKEKKTLKRFEIICIWIQSLH